jgi:NADH-quinone oxidoreductase subunit E
MQKFATVEKILLEFDPEAKNLLPALKKINANFNYVGEREAEIVADYFELSLAKVYETASFYDLIETKKPPMININVCSGGNCSLERSTEIVREIENYFRIKVDNEFNPKVRLEKISCLGRCGEAPIVVVNGKVYEKVTVSGVHRILDEWA